MLACELATGPVVREFLHDLVKQGDIAKDAADYVTSTQELPLPITLAFAIFTINQVNLR